MKLTIYPFIYLFFFVSISLNGQVINSNEIEKGKGIQRNTLFNLEELKVRWKKAALENCPGVPCITNTVPGAPTGVVATAGVASASVAFTAPSSNGGSVIIGYTVTSSPGSISATGASSPINVTGLANGTAYTFTVIATNAVGNSVPSAASAAVTPAPASSCLTPTITDVDLNVYNTVSIGAQCWTKENLRVRKYNDGTAIPFNTSGGTAGNVSSTWNALAIGAHTLYAHDSTAAPSNLLNYGYLYNYYAAAGIITVGGTPTKNICPTGYHVPTDVEWTTLTDFLGGVGVAGGKMKETGTTLWNTPNTGADNTSGFTALPGGYRTDNGSFNFIRDNAFFWSATEGGIFFAWYRSLNASFGNVGRSGSNKSVGGSVRCLRD